jgi:cyclohexanecarboxyl-CoA dehydrogenase
VQFGLTETQQLLQQEVRNFVSNEIVGEARNWDADNFPDDVYADLADMGVLGMTIPEEDGGEGLDPLTAGIVFEELGRGDIGLASLVLVTNLVSELLAEFGNDNHAEVAAECANGQTNLCFGLTEPDHGSDAQAIETTATREGDEWSISGEKTAVTGGIFADYCLVFARDAEADQINAYLLPLDQSGVEVQEYPGMGCEVSGWSQIFLDDARAPEDAKVGDVGGFQMAMEGFDISRAWIGLYCLGGAQQTLDETVQYVLDREAFGKSLAHYEGPQFELAEHQTKVDCARLKAYEALWKAVEERPNTKDSAMVKWFNPKVAVDAIQSCLILHGHYGYSDDFGIEKRLRDAIGLQIGDGTPQVQKLIIARETFGREYLPY